MRYRDEHRQLAAIMFTDIVGYTAMMSADESGALRALKRSRKLVRGLARRFGGRWLESIGDGNLISFASATDAVNCALALQNKLEGEQSLELRIGLHVGDVIEASGHIYGDGVNVASRIHAMADPGGIVVSEPVYDAVRNKSGISIERLGVRDIKGLDHPIQVYSLSGEAIDTPFLGAIDLPGKRRWVVTISLVAIALVGVISTGIYTQYADVRAGTASIAVLPFEDISPDPSNRYFSEGISEELINGLSRVPGLRVAGPSSSFAYGGREQDVRKIGEELNVEYVLDGAVRKAENRVRISTQLVDTENGFQLWNEIYEAEINDIFRVQQDISQAIVEALRLELMPEELADVGRINTSDVQAYDLYLKARDTMRAANSGEDFDEAINLLDRALRRDPTFAEAEAAKCQAIVGKYRQTRDANLMAPAAEVCNRALTMDPQSPLAHIALGNLHLTAGRPEFAVEFFARALPLDPDSAELHADLASALMEEGRIDDAVQFFERALELMPDSASVYQLYGAYMVNAGRLEKGAELLRRATELDPEGARAHTNLGAVLFYLGRFEEADRVLSRAIEIDPRNGRAYNNLGAKYFLTGNYERSLEMLRKAAEYMPHDARLVGGLADACRLAKSCDEWESLYRQAVELADQRLSINPNDVDAMVLKGVYLFYIGRKEEGRRLVERAVENNPDDVSVAFNAAIFWSQYGDREKAREFIARAKTLGYPEPELNAHPDIKLASNEGIEKSNRREMK